MSIQITIKSRFGSEQQAERQGLDEAILFGRNYSVQRNVELVTFNHQERQFTFRDGAMFESCA